MRIDIDAKLEEILDEIKSSNWNITGRGHTETIRFLADFYRSNKSIDELIETHMKKIPDHIREAFQKCLRDVIVNIFSVAGEEALRKVIPPEDGERGHASY